MLFNSDDDANDIFKEIKDHSIAGIYGSRMGTRSKIKEVNKLIESHNNEKEFDSEIEVMNITSATNSIKDEVAFLWDEDSYTLDNAEKIIMKEYNKKVKY